MSPNPETLAVVPQVVDFYEFYEGLQEGWDGPALLVFSDGNHIGARLDRNGLRPARFWQTSDGYIYVASEVRLRPPRASAVARPGTESRLRLFGCEHLGCEGFNWIFQAL